MDKILLGTADISRLDMDFLEKHIDRLSEFRRNKINNLKTDAAKLESFGAGFLLEFMLKQYQSELDFALDANGKLFEKQGRKFNLSHSNGRVMCALSDSEVGCDIEKVRAINSRVFKYGFSSDEIEYISASDINFFKVWTAKESYIKLFGQPLPAVRNIETKISDGKISVKGVHMTTCEIDGYIYSVCTENPHEIQLQDYTHIFDNVLSRFENVLHKNN